MPGSSRASVTLSLGSAPGQAIAHRLLPTLQIGAPGSMNVTAEEAEKMISTATRVEATALWYQFYQQATRFQNASDRELLKWYNVLGNWKALGFSDEQGKQLKETGVTKRLK